MEGLGANLRAWINKPATIGANKEIQHQASSAGRARLARFKAQLCRYSPCHPKQVILVYSTSVWPFVKSGSY